jgi:cell wall-associated NlpC family hydrolase
MMRPAKVLSLLATVGLLSLAVSTPASASVRPVVSSLSRHSGVYWGGPSVTVHGQNFTSVRTVMFGRKQAWGVHVVSATTLTAIVPEHGYGSVHVRVVTATGTSTRTAADTFTFTRPTMNTPIQGGLTARQEQKISARVRAHHRGVHTAHQAKRWTAAMGLTALRRARSWLGLPYSWAGGNSRGPTLGVCAHNGGDLDCHVVGFDCSGLTLYAWAPYEQLVHYAATQHSRAGRFHPAIGSLMPGDLVFFSGYLANGIGHVAIYAGNGYVIQAAESGTTIMRSRLVDVIAASGQYRGATRPMSTGRQGPGPRLSAVTSVIPTKGGYLTLTGTRLSGATSVSVAGTRIYSFAKHTSTHIKVKAPAHRAGQVKVSVFNAWGSATRTTTYVGAPHISKLSPTSGPTAGGTAITLTGTSLSVATSVSVGSVAVPFHVSSTGALTLTAPAHAAGPVAVTVRSRYGTSNQAVFTYVAPVPPGPPTTTGRRAAPPAGRSTPPEGSAPPATSAPAGPSTPAGPSAPPSSSGPSGSSGPPSTGAPGTSAPGTSPPSGDASTGDASTGPPATGG